MMTPRTLLLPLLLMLALALPAQNSLDGTWEGFMTVGGIYSDQQFPMQLYLTSEGSKVKGRSYVQLPDGSTLRMDLEGYRYRDLSISLIETSFAGDATNDIMPEFSRQYQIVFKPDLWDPHLRGYWQEKTEDVFLPKRRRGRMRLTRKKTKGV